MHIPKSSQIVSPLCLVTRKKNDFQWDPEQQQAFAQIKQEIAHAAALGPVRTGPEMMKVLYSAAGNNGLSWSLWQKGRANEEHHNNEQVDKDAKVKVSQVDLDWQHKVEVFLARWAYDASGHQGRDATYRWGCDRGMDLTMDNISQFIHNCETCTAIKQAKWVKPLWYGGRWLKYR
ncbi:hypothetical protein DUI87_03975 [Hirundo rustica rustica]|uniref:Integrase zinc-binding domain-containing protein n=1 Tax=Hirundo rustica rustica TaxID=333673 RepID=A0A3M0L1R1_HIRRU|nr:hypothetical protein DUI87_03975 [Hirundo rustica rustica]